VRLTRPGKTSYSKGYGSCRGQFDLSSFPICDPSARLVVQRCRSGCYAIGEFPFLITRGFRVRSPLPWRIVPIAFLFVSPNFFFGKSFPFRGVLPLLLGFLFAKLCTPERVDFVMRSGFDDPWPEGILRFLLDMLCPCFWRLPHDGTTWIAVWAVYCHFVPLLKDRCFSVSPSFL